MIIQVQLTNAAFTSLSQVDLCGLGVELTNLGSLVRHPKHLMEYLVLDRQIHLCFLSWLQLGRSKRLLHTAWIVYQGVGFLPLEK